MGYIKQLSEDLIKKIAAGEVIERPASVIKELVENSIDAGATRIEIEVERSGKYIKVSDNGMGIDPDDIPLLFSRHATSKIRRFDDLWRIDSLGFRGEALASISSVSKVTCKSKHINQDYGFELKATNGEMNKKISAISIGTVFEIDDLFYNVPARQKFLKSESTELGHISDVIVSEALLRPKIAIKLTNSKNLILKSNASGNLEQNIVEILGNDLQKKLIEVSAKNDFLDLSGYVGSLEIIRSDRKSVFIFVNNRPVKCQIVSKAIFSAFEGLLPPGKFPVVVLNLKFKPTFVDVNVHPSKKEVRYTSPNDVYSLVLHCIQDAVSNHYKKEYKEKSVYSLPACHPEPKAKDLITVKDSSVASLLQNDTLTKTYSEAAFESYAKEEPGSINIKPIESIKQNEEINLFSISNLKCKIAYSAAPVANMTKVANKTIFEVGSIFNDNVQVVFSGEITGEQDYQKSLFNLLSDLSKEIYQTFFKNNSSFQKKLINLDLEDEKIKEQNRKKPPEKLLYEIWERDNWTCVYCDKQLLDAKTVKNAVPEAKDAFVTYINEDGKKVTNHVLREHIASYDHYLPASKLPQFNFDKENLFASCIECNRKKSNSMGQNTWKPKRQNSWTKSLEIAGLCFDTPKSFSPIALKV